MQIQFKGQIFDLDIGGNLTVPVQGDVVSSEALDSFYRRRPSERPLNELTDVCVPRSSAPCT